MPKVALYARYSTDNQSVVSIEDQFRICREHAGRERWQVIDTYHDAAISGASVILRPGVQSLLQDAQRGKFDIVLAEALDRVSRDQADVATLFKHLRFAGVQIVTLAEGEISELHVGLKGTMNALFLKDLAAKTHRGLRGRVEKGKAGGGLCYGYDVVKRIDSEGEPVRGERKINEAEAAIVRRIFGEFAVGKSPRAIATDLNRDGIPGPFGHTWGDTTIRGHACRGNGVVNNELYAGVLVWNRQRFIKDPNTGKRVSRPNPEAKWIRTEVPELRIVDDELWQRVKLRQAELAKQFESTIKGVRAARAERLNRLRRPAFLLSACSLAAVAEPDTASSSTIATAVWVTSARGPATMAGRFAVTTSSGACWRALPTSWYLPRRWQSPCAPMPRKLIARTMSGARKRKRAAVLLGRLIRASRGFSTPSRMECISRP
jgi:DNA invertase Pin-like site-specific DNA recombinase